MKKLFAIAFSVLIISYSADAQVQRKADPTQRVQNDSLRKKGKEYLNDLNLSETQKVQLKGMRDEIKTQREAIQKDASLNAEQKKAKMNELKKSERQKLESILTPEQKAKIKTYDFKGMKGVKGGKGPKGFKGKYSPKQEVLISKYSKELDLTDAQKVKVDAMLKSHMAKAEAIKKDNSLNAQQKTDRLKALRQSEAKELNSYLTPAQQAKAKKILEDLNNKKAKEGKGNRNFDKKPRRTMPAAIKSNS